MSEADSMSETSSDVPAGQANGQIATPPASAGELLRRAREDAGLSLADLAATLKVNVKKLEALETDRLNLLPNAVFSRGLASSVCRTLKLDPAPVLALLPRTDVPAHIEERVGLNTPFRSPSDMVSDSIWDQISRPAILAALVVLVAALVLILFPTIDRSSETATAVPSTTGAGEAVTAGPDAALSGATEQALPGDAAATAAAPAESAPAAVVAQDKTEVALPPPTQAQAQAASETTTQTVAVQASQIPPVAKPVGGPGVIMFSTRGQSWVEVTDAEGGVRLSRLMEAGEVARASGPLPLKVVVGSVDITDVVVRGKPFDLAPVTRSNVARFEVK